MKLVAVFILLHWSMIYLLYWCLIFNSFKLGFLPDEFYEMTWTKADGCKLYFTKLGIPENTAWGSERDWDLWVPISLNQNISALLCFFFFFLLSYLILSLIFLRIMLRLKYIWKNGCSGQEYRWGRKKLECYAQCYSFLL
jgi:cytochrome b561